MKGNGNERYPHSFEAEQSVLGGILYDNKAMPFALEYLKTGQEFYNLKHRLLFAAYLDLFGTGDPIDLMTVSERLRKKQKLDEAGGLDYIARLMELIPTAANVKFHAKIVKEYALRRRLIATSQELSERGKDPSVEDDELLAVLRGMVLDFTEVTGNRGVVDLGEAIEQVIEEIGNQARRNRPVTGLETGFAELDNLTAGLQNGDLVIVAGRPSMGKTALVAQIALLAAEKSGGAVAMFTIEMVATRIVRRMLSLLSLVPLSVLRSGYLSKSDWDNFQTAAETLYELRERLRIDESPFQNVEDIRVKALRMDSESRLSLVVVDYLQLMGTRKKTSNRTLELGEITRQLKGLARELNVPVLVISQLSRKVEERPNKKPQLSDLRESGSIEQDADVVLFIYRDAVYNEDADERDAEVIIAKQRDGGLGTVRLVWDAERTSFRDTDETEERSVEQCAFDMEGN